MPALDMKALAHFVKCCLMLTCSLSSWQVPVFIGFCPLRNEDLLSDTPQAAASVQGCMQASGLPKDASEYTIICLRCPDCAYACVPCTSQLPACQLCTESTSRACVLQSWR
jgi:hypothetical protein